MAYDCKLLKFTKIIKQWLNLNEMSRIYLHSRKNEVLPIYVR